MSDLAHNAIEIIDRNLYERSCDVRWWATDSAVVDAASHPENAEMLTHVTSRLATILRSYTVYIDLWVIDTSGTVIASGRPDSYNVVGTNVSDRSWFKSGLGVKNGDHYAVGDIERNQLLGGALTATYTTAIRRNGDLDGTPVGVLAIFFDWSTQAKAVLDGVSLSAAEKTNTRIILLDATNRVIASSNNQGVLEERIALDCKNKNGKRGFFTRNGRLIAYAETPGYETYPGLGWKGVIDAPYEQQRPFKA